MQTGGTQPTGGVEETGGVVQTGGTQPIGGVEETGGTEETGGVEATGGTEEMGGTAGTPEVTAGTAGAPPTGGAAGMPNKGGAGGAIDLVDECALGLDDCAGDATCVDTVDGFECVCPAGYAWDGAACTDVDECEAGTDDCAEDATCTDTDGGYTCQCNAGFAGNGVTCADVNECATDADDCDANATCTNEPGTFTCACNDGYSGDGVTCADVDECATGADDCSENAACANTVGSFTCTCNAGFVGNGVVCSSSCGDGVVDEGEQCDDGNADADDGCTTCVADPGYTCEGAPSVCTSFCGNGLVGPDEECDDGNSAELDGCTSACTLECGDGALNGIVSVTVTYLEASCGVPGVEIWVNDGEPLSLDSGPCNCYPGIRSVEVTDPAFLASFRREGNQVSLTGPLGHYAYFSWVVLTVEYLGIGSEDIVAYDYAGGRAETRNPNLCDGYNEYFEWDDLTVGPEFGLPFAGIAGESCDDGNRASNDGCSETCVSECGNGIIDDAETCDDGNVLAGDGCSASCNQIEHGWSCRREPSICTATCGDGVIASSERCDDGDADSEDGCSDSCTVEPYWACSGEPSGCYELDPTESCVGHCGDSSATCGCGGDCLFYGTCCDDFIDVCGGNA